MSKFKVGDRLEAIEGLTKGAGWRLGRVGTVKRITEGIKPIYWFTEFQDGVYEDSLKLFCGENIKTNTKNIMSKVKDFVKNLALSADEKLLRKHGFKSDCGEYTEEAKDFAILKACEASESDMLVVAKGLEAEEKKN